MQCLFMEILGYEHLHLETANFLIEKYNSRISADDVRQVYSETRRKVEGNTNFRDIRTVDVTFGCALSSLEGKLVS